MRLIFCLFKCEHTVLRCAAAVLTEISSFHGFVAGDPCRNGAPPSLSLSFALYQFPSRSPPCGPVDCCRGPGCHRMPSVSCASCSTASAGSHLSELVIPGTARPWRLFQYPPARSSTVWCRIQRNFCVCCLAKHAHHHLANSSS